MGFYPQNRDVVFSISIPTIIFDFNAQNFVIKIKGKVVISTQDKITKARSLYINPINGI